MCISKSGLGYLSHSYINYTIAICKHFCTRGEMAKKGMKLRLGKVVSGWEFTTFPSPARGDGAAGDFR